MRLRDINPPDTHKQVVTCYGCGRRVRLSECQADLDGPAFKAFYCPMCVHEIAREGRAS